MPVMFDIEKSLSGLLSFGGAHGMLKVQKDGLEIRLDKTTTQVPYNLVHSISAVSADVVTQIHLKVGINQNNKIKEETLKLYLLYFHNYPLTADDMAKAGNPAVLDAWARSVVSFINDIKAKTQ
jgi:hypothetical protein